MKNLKDDFKDFMVSDVAPPAHLSDLILAKIKHDLNPSAFRVFVKVLGIHSIVSLFTLSLCSQFGFRLFGQGPGLMNYFMKFGNYGCMAACGVLFLGVTSFTAALWLNQAEGKRLLREWPIHILILVGFSLAFFLSVDAYLSLATVLWWILGSFAGAYLFLRGGFSLRRIFVVRGNL